MAYREDSTVEDSVALPISTGEKVMGAALAVVLATPFVVGIVQVTLGI